MKINQVIGAGSGPQANLACEILDIQSDGIKARVINGNWYLTFLSSGKTIMHGPQGDEEINCKILYTGYIPQYDYNTVIDYINDQLSAKWWKFSWVSSLIHMYTTRIYTCKIVRALIAAKNAFINSYSPKPAPEYNDDIPF